MSHIIKNIHSKFIILLFLHGSIIFFSYSLNKILKEKTRKNNKEKYFILNKYIKH